MINIIYNLLLWLILPLLVPFHAYRSLSRGRRTAFLERFGRIPSEELDLIGNGGGTILVHAVSVGETNAALPLLKGIRQRFPGKKIVVSNVTETGRSVAQKSKAADLCIYFPFDYPFAVRSVLEQIRPELVVIMETEIWPNFIAVARELGIPVLLANGRISDRSFGRYLRLSWFFRPVLQRLSALCMQTAVDAERIRAIGAPPAAVHVGGNLKYDIPVVKAPAQQVARIKEKYQIPTDCFVFAAASTHEGEEAQVLSAYRDLLARDPQSFLILAPRHPERAPGVAELIKKEGFPFQSRSALDGSGPLPAGGILLLDTVGELAGLYRASDLVFVGGSLVPTGGHNPLEPAACQVPVLFGPHMENFREIAALFVKHCGAEVQPPDVAALKSEVMRLAADASLREELGRRGAGILLESAGATGRHLDVMASLLERGGQRG
ncbi:3-deoxy-D-manno-octulosonic acid transferase [Geomonas nitrogeniifigens]|uniref:3-deoxy-D-manno-octulosonic acid transferase n=1 Tax=Geomonas diazotrophica TaxID=2843197 RepID=UPI001C2C254E|nr:3-deoxy-D-manno-octulosonic acid transferase [Geomonas nitrogeniifigens]QXE88923.1 3-deoxy-D-manno-octulosonic acid transferase [Geomonas nitrogeniifigens]